MKEKHEICVSVRWMLRKDSEEVVAIEKMCFQNPLTMDELSGIMTRGGRHITGLVAEHKEKVVGFIILTMRKGQIKIVSLAVHPNYQRLGVGSKLMMEAKSRICIKEMPKIVCLIRESNDEGRKFLTDKHSFKAKKLIPVYYKNPHEGAMRLEYCSHDDDLIVQDGIVVGLNLEEIIWLTGPPYEKHDS